MPTEYELQYSWVDESLGQIETIAVWPVWDCVAKNWSNAPKLTLRNTLLSGIKMLVESASALEKFQKIPRMPLF